MAADEIPEVKRALGNGHCIEDMLAKLGCGTIAGVSSRFKAMTGDSRKYGLNVVGINAGVLVHECV